MASAAAERRRSSGGRVGWRSAFTPPRVSPLGLPCPSSPRGAGAGCPRRAYSLVPALPRAPRLPRGGWVEGLGRGARARARGRRAAAFALGAGPSRSPRPHGALGASRDARRGGGPPWRLPGVVRVRPPTPGGLRASARAGRPPTGRLPPAALDGSRLLGPSDVVRSEPALPRLRVSPPPAPTPRPRARVRLLAFPAPAALFPRASRALPACAPLPAAAPRPRRRRGPGFAGAGRDAGVGRRELRGARARKRGPVRPGGAGGGGVKEWGRRRCRVPV